MNLTLFFGLLGGLLVLAFLANLLARRTGIPDVLVLMGIGVLLGPILHLMDLSKYPGLREGFGTLALILILLEAGLELDLRQLIRSVPAGLLLAVSSYVLGFVLIAPAAHRLLGLQWKESLIVAAVLGGVSASVALPVLQILHIRPSLRMILVVEGAMADILSVLAVTSLLNSPVGTVPVGSLFRDIAVKIVISFVLGIAAGVGWAFLLPKLSDRRFWQVLSFGMVLVLYTVTEVSGGADLLAVLIFGLALSNLPQARRYLSEAIGFLESSEQPGGEHIGLLAFHAELSFLIRTFFFVLVGMDIRFEGFLAEWKSIVVIFIAIVIARWVAVQISRLLWHKSLSMERSLAFWMHPRGLITVVLALQVVNALGPSWRFLVDLSFAILLLSGVDMTIGTVRGKRMASLVDTPAEKPAA